jgi:hypothetical protein
MTARIAVRRNADPKILENQELPLSPDVTDFVADFSFIFSSLVQ